MSSDIEHRSELDAQNDVYAQVESSAYSKEYAEKQPDRMCVRLGAIVPGDRVVLIDDLIATGGTALSGMPLLCIVLL